ncbi:MAG TPA: CheR family methyltransferase [Methylophilaceae bacterium]|jgi:chemotaxis protein methyltransferase CheR
MPNPAIHSSTPHHEFDFTDQDFKRICKQIYEHAGIKLSDVKKDMVYSRVSRRLRAIGLTSFHEYLALLETDNKEEREAFVNSLTTNLTSFFREPHHFPLLAEHIEKIKSRGPLDIWCCAASTGEEPYSLAITMMDLFKSYTPPVRILATDLDTNVLEKAEDGIYAMERVEQLPKDVLKRFFLKGKGRNQDNVQVRSELRDMITFRQLNLLDPSWAVRGPFDAVFCRNVMIYFDRPTQYSILKKFVPVMHQDALLFAGHSESFQHAVDLFQNRGRTIYTIAQSSLPLAAKVK